MLNNIILFFSGAIITVTSLFIPKPIPSVIPSPTQANITIESVVTLSPAPNNDYYIAEKTIEEQGQTVTIHMEISKTTPEVKGTIGGICKGTITGSQSKNSKIYNAIDLEGSANGNCFFVVPASAVFKGKYETNTGRNFVSIEITATVNGSTIEKNITLPIINP